ncbi:hypothetical protein KP509_03G068600 [Ceratopteris richardii]|uniref:1-phosphatidylinositol-4-phosphate 5-kinase n=1 Tax=Ceratopteris richardii TaxID=49495 RepID=A0A8T2V8D9_CERRI|nr:hypothetical protein KP509_03G068600 [Ceratopteris richardii]
MGLCNIAVHMFDIGIRAQGNSVSPLSPDEKSPDKGCGLFNSVRFTAQNAEENDTFRDHLFPNGDVYVGFWKGKLPDGIGKYLWKDGCMYEGEWRKGKMSGKGKMFWPSGASYQGDFLAGFINGFGSYTGADGSTYTGSWFLNERRGFGTKVYPNGDFYEGSWNNGVQEGEGKYAWKDGDLYVGEWRSGFKTGRGTMKWACGDKYDGQWLHGLPHSRGVFTRKNTGTYIGTWRGFKDAWGSFIPSGSLSSFERKDVNKGMKSDSPMILSAKGGLPFPEAQEDTSKDMLPGTRLFQERSTISESSTSSESGLEDSSYSFLSPGDSLDFFFTEDHDAYDVKGPENFSHRRNSTEEDFHVSPVFSKHYVQGVFDGEDVKEGSSQSTHMLLQTQNEHFASDHKKPGERISKGHRKYELMMSLQLGIRYTIGKKNCEQSCDISVADFGRRARVELSFPKQGSQLTPPHQSADFRWKDYCPAVFRHLRELFKIDTAEYLMSICGDDGLRQLSSSGKSGSIFYISHDGRFLIKTVRKPEGKVLLGMLRNYYNYLQTNENTLITKFYGLHRIKPAGGRKVRFVVMGNIFRTDLCIDKRFDLKGSSYGRSVQKLKIDESTTLKDLDLDFVFLLRSYQRDILLRQVESDCKFLESEHIMDYSLLLGLHFQTSQIQLPGLKKSKFPSGPKEIAKGRTQMEEVNEAADMDFPDAANLILAPCESTGGSFSPHLQSKACSLEEQENTRLGIRQCVNMPVMANKKPPFEGKALLSRQQGEARDVLLYFGIIDILQKYNMGKKLEHAYKSLHHDPLSISAVDPSSYSHRFQNFIRKIFVEHTAG